MDWYTACFLMALPNGSMHEQVMRLLRSSKIEEEILYEVCRDIGKAKIDRFDFFRPQEIPRLLERGIYQIGLVGKDLIVEQGVDVWEVETFNLSRKTFQATKLVLAIPADSSYCTVNDLPEGAVIATEYPVMTRNYLNLMGRPDINVELSWGKTEDKPGLGICNAIVDLMETGNSLQVCNLRVIGVIAESQLTLSAYRDCKNDVFQRKAIYAIAGLLGSAYERIKGNE